MKTRTKNNTKKFLKGLGIALIIFIGISIVLNILNYALFPNFPNVAGNTSTSLLLWFLIRAFVGAVVLIAAGFFIAKKYFSKKGDEKYILIIGTILGLIVSSSIAFTFLFYNKGFTLETGIKLIIKIVQVAFFFWVGYFIKIKFFINRKK